MKKLQAILAALTLAAAGASAYAAPTSTPLAEFFGAGSSAQTNLYALAAAGTTPGSAGLCGAHHYSAKNAVNLVDPRNGAILPELANIWIVWNDAAAAGTDSSAIVCYYATVDSIVGMRAYFANATLSVGSLPAFANLIPFIGGDASDSTVPANVLNYINGSKINFAATDIRPEDAKFATMRTLTAYGSFITGRGFTGVGYQGTVSTPWLGVPIVSSVSTTQANPVDWAFVPGDVDPVTGGSVRVYRELPVGAAPIVVVVNASNSGSGHMGDPALAISDVSKQVLTTALLGNMGHVRDLSSATGAATAGDAALHVWVREPLSGTYNTMDFDIPNENDIAGDYAQTTGRVTGQEAGITTTNTACAGHQTASGCPAESGNPLFHFVTPAIGSPNGSTRGRVVGAGEMLNTVNGVPDSLGYAFWGYSAFAGKSNLKYVTVGGVDPFFAGYSNGALPTCSATPCILPFTNIKNGGYPIWSMYRSVYDYTDSRSIATNIVTLAQTASTTAYSDFVPFSAMNVFRSHFYQVVTTSGGAYPPNNGVKTGVPETGGDMGGMVLTKQSEVDFIADTGGNQQVGFKN